MPVTSSLLIHQMIHPTTQNPYALVHSIFSLALNVVATVFIAGRLLVHRYRIVSQLGRAHGHHYVSIATVVTESAAVYTGFLVIVIVANVLKSPALSLLEQMIVQIQVRNARASVVSIRD